MAIQRQPGNSLTAAEVLAYARRISETNADVGVNMCQRFVRMAAGSPGGAPTALAAWSAARYKHTKGTPPPGAFVFWGGGSAGHVAISAGNGMVYSTDVREPGRVDLVDMDYITSQWGKPLLGWSEDNNGRRITSFNAKPVKEGAGAKGKPSYDPVYAGNSTVAGGPESTRYSKKELRERYGFAAAFYDQAPELQQLLNRAVKAQWTEEEFEARFRATKWYRKHTEEEREFALLSTSQPAEAAQRVNQAKTDIVNLYRQMGVPVGKARIDAIARASVVKGWTPQQVKNAIAAEFDYNPDNVFGGQAGQTIDELRGMAGSYLVPLSNKTLEQWTENVLRGEADPESFRTYLKEQAKSLFPELAAEIDRGLTTEDYLNPYRELAARELEISPDAVDWTDPKWSRAIFATDEKGGRRPLGLAEWQRTLRTDQKYGYNQTSTAKDAAAQFATEFRQMFVGA